MSWVVPIAFMVLLVWIIFLDDGLRETGKRLSATEKLLATVIERNELVATDVSPEEAKRQLDQTIARYLKTKSETQP